MGVSNAHSHEDSGSSISRSTVSLIHADKLVKVAQQDRPYDPAARETRVEDRPTLARVHDKMFRTHGERFVHKVLRSYAQDGSGLLTPDQLRDALDRLHLGLDRTERERIVARVMPEQSGTVHYLDFMRSFAVPQPLGDEAVAVARGISVPGPPTVRPGGGGSGVGDGGKSYWNWTRNPKERIPGLLDEVREGTFEQAQSDSLLTSLLATKLSQYRDKLRIVFRQMDANRNSRIDREEFAKGLAKLRISVSRPQADRLFELCDTDRNGVIDYEEFVDRFDEHGLAKQNTDQAKQRLRTGASGGVPLSQSMLLSQDEVVSALRHPLVLELARSLYGKGRSATAVFQRQDLPRSGCLDVRDMTSCCRALVPGIDERQVAAVMASLEPSSTGHMDYRAFVSGMLDGALNHPRLLHSAPAGGKSSSLGALARFGEPLTAPEAIPSQHTRALSAVSLSRRDDHDPSVTSGPSHHARPPPTSAVPPDRNAMYDLHDVAITPLLEALDRTERAAPGAAWGDGGSGVDGTSDGGTLPTVTRSVDMGSLARTQQRMHQARLEAVPGGRRAGAPANSQAPTHATGRFSRFWDKRYNDTSTITAADTASALCTPAEGTWVRKGQNDDFLRFQGDDRAREVKRRDQLVQRYNARSDIDAKYSAQDDASGADDGRLATAKASKQRHEERCEMYDRLRQMEDRGDHTFFGRLPPFREHKADVVNTPTRSYW